MKGRKEGGKRMKEGGKEGNISNCQGDKQFTGHCRLKAAAEHTRDL